ncbi:MAG: ABC transporter ATP-binding protein [Planctomycetota bacterium]|nr:ABC transporter ATP-binding protein [Planctomycetota bacterium]
MIEIKDFSKSYGDFLAVNHLNLHIQKGEIFGFIGPNGAGKSTTIRFLATLLKASQGEGFIGGFSVTKQPLEVRRTIGYMPDSFGVYEGMRVWEFLDFFSVAYQISQTRRKQVLSDVLELLDLTHKRDDYVSGLSRGMKQRLCLAKTLVHDPPVLILDEPASGLDPRARLEIKALLKELQSMGKTILISSHILSELADCCSSIGIIERGQLLMAGPIQEIYDRIQDHRQIHVKILEGMDRAIRLLQNHSNTLDIQPFEDRILLRFSGSDDDLSALLESLLLENVRVLEFSEKEPTLEEVFMQVTKGLVS